MIKRLALSARESLNNLSLFERGLWICSVCVVLFSFLLAGRVDVLVLLASLVGVSALIFLAKGDVIGNIICIIFSFLYAAVSFRFAYYGEMLTYIGMSAVVSMISTITWLKNPYSKKQVRVARTSPRGVALLGLATIAVTVVFYFLLDVLGTANLYVSTLSVATSFAAATLAAMRSPYYALAYAANDLVLIALWVFAAFSDIYSLPMVFCFLAFLFNDLYGYVNWKRMRRLQSEVGGDTQRIS